MNMFDEARSMKGMMEMCKLTQGEMARKLGVSQSYVANKLRLLKFSETMQSDIAASGITERHARTLLRLEDEELRRRAFDKICADGLTVAESEALVDFLHDGTAPKMIGNATKLSRIDTFKATLKSSVATLIQLGVDARHSTNCYGTKTYITICIDEG